MDLISYYARLVATLNPILTDIAPQLVEMLIKDFKFQVSHLYVIISTVDLSFFVLQVFKKDQTHIQSKLKTCKFIGQLYDQTLFDL